MHVTLKDLRSMAAMAQFSPREVRPDILRLIESSADVAGEALVSVDSDSVLVIQPAPKVS